MIRVLPALCCLFATNVLMASNLKPVFNIEGTREYRLENGMKIVLHPMPKAKEVDIVIVYDIGNFVDDRQNQGQAHLLEHMLFKGTKSDRDNWASLTKVAPANNAMTSGDFTFYHDGGAKKEDIDTVLRMEADRMRNVLFDPQDFAREKDLIISEHVEYLDNISQRLSSIASRSSYDYQGYGGGYTNNKTVDALTLESTKKLYDEYYQPDRATLIVSGDFDEKNILNLAEKNFAAIPKPSREALPSRVYEPKQTTEKRVVLHLKDQASAFNLVYRGPSGLSDESTPLSALLYMMAHTSNAPLKEKYIKSGIISSLSSKVGTNIDGSLLEFSAELVSNNKAVSIAEDFAKYLEALPPALLTEAQLEEYKTLRLKQYENYRNDPGEINIALTYAIGLGDWRMLLVERERIQNLKLSDVKASLNWLKANNRILVINDRSANPKSIPDDPKPKIQDVMAKYSSGFSEGLGLGLSAISEQKELKEKSGTTADGVEYRIIPYEGKLNRSFVRVNLSVHADPQRFAESRIQWLALSEYFVELGSDLPAEQDSYARPFKALSANFYWLAPERPNLEIILQSTADTSLSKLELLKSILRHPKFDKKRFENARNRLIWKHETELNDPLDEAKDAAEMALRSFPKSDMRSYMTRRQIIEGLRKVKLSEIEGLYRSSLGSTGTAVTAWTSLESDKLFPAIEAIFKDWKNPIAPLKTLQKSTQPLALLTHDIHIDTPEKSSGVVVVGIRKHVVDADKEFEQFNSFIARDWSDMRWRIMDTLGHSSRIDYTLENVKGRDYVTAIISVRCRPSLVPKVKEFLAKELEIRQNWKYIPVPALDLSKSIPLRPKRFDYVKSFVAVENKNLDWFSFVDYFRSFYAKENVIFVTAYDPKSNDFETLAGLGH